jgi:hypothetical protein
MSYLYAVYELGNFEFMGTAAECDAYVLANAFHDSFFSIVLI